MQPTHETAGSKRRGNIPRGMAAEGPALLSYGFRPFFLGAGVFALVSMCCWIAALTLGWDVGGTTYGALAWHAHEMLFGYTTAALAGFMLTAIPNWTGRLPVSGLPLLWLFIVWVAGRVAMLNPDAFVYPVLAALVDGAFLPVLAAIAGREIIEGKNWKNLKILIALCLLTGVNLAFHLQVLAAGDLSVVVRGGVSIFVALIGLVGGRIIPSFTRNWLVKAKIAELPRPFGRFDIVAMTALILALATWTALPESPVLVVLALITAVLQAIRLTRWRGAATLEEPLLVVLHVAYSFLPLGLVCIALAGLGWISAPSALHVLTVGALGNTTLAVMTRATLGHTGQKLTASIWTSMSYVLLLLAAVVRPFAEVLPEFYHVVLGFSGVCWIGAFVLFSIEYGSMLVGPKAGS